MWIMRPSSTGKMHVRRSNVSNLAWCGPYKLGFEPEVVFDAAANVCRRCWLCLVAAYQDRLPL